VRRPLSLPFRVSTGAGPDGRPLASMRLASPRKVRRRWLVGSGADPHRQQNRPDVSGRLQVCHQLCVVAMELRGSSAPYALLRTGRSRGYSVFVRKVYRRLHPLRKRSGGAEEARTPDPLLAKEVLSQLSYGPRIPSCEGSAGGAFWTRTRDLSPPATALPSQPQDPLDLFPSLPRLEEPLPSPG
jgi:hypothetical protein